MFRWLCTFSLFLLVTTIIGCTEGPEPAEEAGEPVGDPRPESHFGEETPGPTPPAAPAPPRTGRESAPPTDGPPTPLGEVGVEVDPDQPCVFHPAPETLPSCCGESDSLCVPKSSATYRYHHWLEPCGDDGICVPSDMMAAVGEYDPTACTSVMGTAGVCMSACVPGVGEVAELLPQDICDAGSLCTPCINPLDGQPTNICQIFECVAPEDSPEDIELPEPVEEKEVYSCDNLPEEPMVDISAFPPCCEGARCIPAGLVDEAVAEDLYTCGDEGTSVCVPEESLAWAGLHTATTCYLPGDMEGRCLSTCLPVIVDNLDSLPQAGCDDTQRCAPCCDPFTGEDLGVCDLGCDTGPADGACGEPAYETCCENKGGGHCVPSELVPDESAKSLEKEKCEQGFLCAPDDLADETFVPETCLGQIPFLATYEGVCLPKCLKIPLDFLFWSGSCDNTQDCVPCNDPITGGPTDAPGCPGT